MNSETVMLVAVVPTELLVLKLTSVTVVSVVGSSGNVPVVTL